MEVLVKLTFKGAHPELILVVNPAVTCALDCIVIHRHIISNGNAKTPDGLFFILLRFTNKFIPICPKINKKQRASQKINENFQQNLAY